MNDPVAVALKRRAHRMLGLRMEPPAGLLRLRRVRRETDPGDHAPSYAAPRSPSIAPVRPSRKAAPNRLDTTGWRTPPESIRRGIGIHVSNGRAFWLSWRNRRERRRGIHSRNL